MVKKTYVVYMRRRWQSFSSCSVGQIRSENRPGHPRNQNLVLLYYVLVIHLF